MFLILDANNLCYAALFSTGELSYNNKNTGIIFGFLKRLFSLVKDYRPEQVIIAWDSRRSYRRKVYPEYKAHRRDKSAEDQAVLELAYQQFNEIRESVLPRMGFGNNHLLVGMEADDVIAWYTSRLPADYLVVSTDQDLYQLLRKDHKYETKIWNPKTGKEFSIKEFRLVYGIEPHQWVLAKAIGGCNSDNVKGIEGIGDPAKSPSSKAIKYIQGTLTEGKIYDRIVSEEGQAIINRNLNLVTLPYFHEDDCKLELKEDNFHSMDWLDVFDDYGFRSFSNDIDNLRDLFKLKKGRREG